VTKPSCHPPKTRRAKLRERVLLNKSHRRAMQRDSVWRADLRAYDIRVNVATLCDRGLLIRPPQPPHSCPWPAWYVVPAKYAVPANTKEPT